MTFAHQSLRQFEPYYADLTFLHRQAPLEVKMQALQAADVVILEVVERQFGTSTSSGLIEPAFLDRLAREITAPSG